MKSSLLHRVLLKMFHGKETGFFALEKVAYLFHISVILGLRYGLEILIHGFITRKLTIVDKAFFWNVCFYIIWPPIYGHASCGKGGKNFFRYIAFYRMRIFKTDAKFIAIQNRQFTLI